MNRNDRSSPYASHFNKPKKHKNRTYSVTFSPIPTNLSGATLELFFGEYLSSFDILLFDLQQNGSTLQIDFQSEAIQKKIGTIDLVWNNQKITSSIVSNKETFLNVPIATEKLQKWAFNYWEKFIPNFSKPIFIFNDNKNSSCSVLVPESFKRIIEPFRLAYTTFPHKHAEKIVSRFESKNSTNWVIDHYCSNVIIIGLHAEIIKIEKDKILRYSDSTYQNPAQKLPENKNPKLTEHTPHAAAVPPRGKSSLPSICKPPSHKKHQKHNGVDINRQFQPSLDALTINDAPKPPSWKKKSSDGINGLDLADQLNLVHQPKIQVLAGKKRRKGNKTKKYGKGISPPAHREKKQYECPSLPVDHTSLPYPPPALSIKPPPFAFSNSNSTIVPPSVSHLNTSFNSPFNHLSNPPKSFPANPHDYPAPNPTVTRPPPSYNPGAASFSSPVYAHSILPLAQPAHPSGRVPAPGFTSVHMTGSTVPYHPSNPPGTNPTPAYGSPWSHTPAPPGGYGGR